MASTNFFEVANFFISLTTASIFFCVRRLKIRLRADTRIAFFADEVIAIKKYKIQGVVSGALASNYQKERIGRICKELNLKSIAPLWHVNPEQYLNDLIKNKFRAIITGIAADGLAKEFLGAEINEEFIKKIKGHTDHHCGTFDW